MIRSTQAGRQYATKGCQKRPLRNLTQYLERQSLCIRVSQMITRGKIMENALAKMLASGSTLHVFFLSKILPAYLIRDQQGSRRGSTHQRVFALRPATHARRPVYPGGALKSESYIKNGGEPRP
jgi:hypothetical protein